MFFQMSRLKEYNPYFALDCLQGFGCFQKLV